MGQPTGRITGRVIDKATHSPIIFANLVIDGTTIGTSSQIDGSFVIPRVFPGKQSVIVSVIGYSRISREVLVESGKTAIVEIQMEESPVATPEVTVRADVPVSAASSAMIQALDFQLRPRLSTQDLLRLVPGLFIAQHAGGGKAEQIFLRGFDADHGTDVNISVDGIPVNMVSHGHGQGYADLHFVIPEVLRGLEVYKGPYRTQIGDFGTAGAVKFNTLDDIDQNSLSVEGGSFGLVRLVGIGRLPIGSDMTNAYLAGEILHNDSYFDRKQDFRRYNLFGKMIARIDQQQAITLWTSGFSSRWNASGQIPERAVAQAIISRYGSIDPSEGGETNRQNINLEYSNVGRESKFLAQTFASRYHFQLFSDFTFFKNDPVNGDEIEQDDDRTILGGRLEYSLNFLRNNPAASTLVGAAVRTDGITNQLWHVTQRRRLDNRANADIRETAIAFYIQQDYLFSPVVRLQLGLRNDNFIFDLADRLNPGTPKDLSGRVTQSLLSPKANVTISPSSSLDLFVNFGTGFHSNDARGVVAQRSQTTLPRAVGAELGARYTAGARFSTGIALWGLDLEHEFVYSGDGGGTEEQGATRRIGMDIDTRLQLCAWLWGDIDLTVSRGRFRDLPEGENYIPLAPTFTTTGGLTFRWAGGMEGNIRYRHIGRRAANDANTVTAKGYTIIDAGIAYRLDVYRLSITAENLFNAEWNEAQFETESQLRGEAHPTSELHFTPGTPLSLRAKIEFGF